MSGGPLDFPDDPPPDAPPGEAGAAEPDGPSRPARGRAAPTPAAARSAAGPARPARPDRSLLARLRPAGSTRYGWLAAMLVLLVIVWVSLSTLHSDGGGATGLAAGTRLPPFATALASNAAEDGTPADIATRPNQGSAGKRPACTVRGPQILNVCQLAERGPVVLAFLVSGGGDCVTELDRLQSVVRAFPGVQLAAVAFRSKRTDVLRLAADHGWRFPIGMDPDNRVTNLYGVLVCPQVTYAYPGGVVRGTTIGEESEAMIRGRVRRLVAAARARGWTPS
jgi:peroxiredoxin